MLDVLIRDGLIVDGTGQPGYKADIGILGTRIVKIGKPEDIAAANEIDASGKVVAPGLISDKSEVHETPISTSLSFNISSDATDPPVGKPGVTGMPLNGRVTPEQKAPTGRARRI